mmetsp:Transcript_7515/g.21460  ORF Transcript_7515/g.21460 Transcript_7515/m.21460 type:complete len:215 (+) Transcript_7515:737-1381(+)
MRRSPRKLRLNCCKLKASRVKSICAWMTSSNSPRLKGSVMWRNFSENSTTFHKMSRSMNALSTTPGCCTLTATSLSLPPGPSKANSGLRRARWTWPTDPLATGSSSNSSNNSLTSRPSSIRRTSLVTSEGWLGASERSFASVWITSGGNMSGRIESHWPNFWKAAPARCVHSSICSSQYSRQRWLSLKTSTQQEDAKKGVNTHAKNTDRRKVNQ